MVDRTRRRGGLVGRLIGSPPAGAAKRRATGPAVETRPSVPAPVTSRDPAAWLPADAVPEAGSAEHAPGHAPDEPAPVSPETDQTDDAWASRWLPDQAPASAAAMNAPPAAAPEHSQWLPQAAVTVAAAVAVDPRESTATLATVDPSRLARSVGAYCNELLDPRLTPEATETILSRFHAASQKSHATVGELLRLTRKTTADYALAPNGWRGAAAAARREECRATPARLAACEAHTLAPPARAELAAHLDHCLSCQAIELRCRRAERAFTTTLAATYLDEETGATAAEPLADEAPAPGHRAVSLRRTAVLAGAGLLLAACAAVALVLIGSGSRPQATTAVPASATSVPARAASRHSTHRAAAPKRHVLRHPGRAHHPAKHSKPRSGGGGASTAVASTPAGSSAAATAPASGAAPSAPAPAPAPAAGSGSSGAGGSSGSAGGSSASAGPVSVTQQGSSLPAQSAPTQGISSGGSAGSQH